ncbi:MAG: thiamine diphosphokinase [Chloroflexi bacterium]|nr:thiamine diphosphokinase [Chloroflexota bacterium]MCI0580951.1 thiamine diphosphokinase [Chloroflexota bacterium]MCI0645039.1 thiamine diphosphokinase [Chloroflexota bacterium]MCI0725614.1 thiamine diphosphokinase [Chloroflexota bacterium]
MSVLIFAHGEIGDVEWIRPYLAGAAAVIAADGGTQYLMTLGRPPDVVIGDLDSLSGAARAELAAAGATFAVYPAAKDESDLELALLYATIHYEDDILVFGASGGRLDHLLANMLLLAHPALQGRVVQVVEARQRAWLVETETRIQGAAGDLVSLLPLSGDVRVAQTTNLLWPLEDKVLVFGPARGLSNVMTAGTATVMVKSGRLLVIHTQQT